MHQKNSSIYFSLLAGFLLTSIPSANASQGTLEYCQKVSDKIRYYSSLRKMGGSHKAMENWKQQRKNHKEKFINRNCQKLKDEIKD